MHMQMATVLIYLSAPEEGGETVFPLEGEHGLDRLPSIDYTSCDVGLKVTADIWSVRRSGKQELLRHYASASQVDKTSGSSSVCPCTLCCQAN